MDKFRFREVTRADLPMLADWLRQPAVAEWWGDPGEQLGLVTEDLDEPAMTQLIASRGDRAMGYAQHYPAHHWQAPHFADLPADCIAIDCFSGPDGFGQGRHWLRALSDRLLAGASCVVIDPDPDNLRAIRACRHAGFGGDRVQPCEDGSPACVLTRHR